MFNDAGADNYGSPVRVALAATPKIHVGSLTLPRKRLGGWGVAGGEVFIYVLGPAVCLAPPGVTHFHDNASSVAAVSQGNTHSDEEQANATV